MKQSSLDESLRMGFEQSEEEKRELEDQQAVEDTGNMPQPPSPNMSVHPPTKGEVPLMMFVIPTLFS